MRRLRIGFAESIAVGSVLVRGGGVLSVLKVDAAYPGKLADEPQWVAAERLADGVVSRKEVDNEGYALWVLPPGTKTRALRFIPSRINNMTECGGCGMLVKCLEENSN